MAYLLQVLTPPNTRLGDCLLPSAKEEVLGRPLMVTTLLLPLAQAHALAVYLSRSLALAHVHLLFPLFRFVAVLVVSSVYFSNSSSCYCCCYFCPLSRHRGRTHDDKRGRRRQDTRTTVIMLMMMMRHNWKIIEIKIKKR